MTTKTIDLKFEPHPITGDVSIRKGTSAIMQALRTIVMTSATDIPFDPDGWGNLQDKLGENSHSLLALDIEQQISEAIRHKEPRIELISVKATPFSNLHGYNVDVKFYVVNVPIEEKLTVPIRRLR